MSLHTFESVVSALSEQLIPQRAARAAAGHCRLHSPLITCPCSDSGTRSMYSSRCARM